MGSSTLRQCCPSRIHRSELVFVTRKTLGVVTQMYCWLQIPVNVITEQTFELALYDSM